jgi:hypothetical protein
MYRQTKLVRLLLVAVLAVSTSSAAVCTPVSAQGLASVKSRAKPVRFKCCCGTEDGRCCGMACCMRGQSDQVPLNPPMRTTVEKTAGQAMALLVAAAIDSPTCDGHLHRAAASNFYGLLAASLQSQHVRIQT